MFDITGGLVTFFAVIAISYAFRSYFAKPKLPSGVQLPPGPTSLQLLGSALASDADAPWVTYQAWGSQYGDMVHTRLFGQDKIVVNSEETARDLLDHRSQNYSDRPEIYNTAFMRYSSRWRLHRKIFHQSFRQDMIPNFRLMQVTKAHELLLNLMEDPLHYATHLDVYSASVIVSAVYSYNAARRDDHMIERMMKGLDVMREMTPVTAVFFNAFPSCRPCHPFHPAVLCLPSWLPGMHIKRVAPLAKKLVLDFLETPFAHTETASVLMNFILAMILYPHVQERAHDLIESVVGTSRLPTFQDRSSLPYVDAILRECMRWHPVFPFGIMHAAVESDVYKGTTIIPNVWAMCHNEEKYRNASEFNPDRFLNPDGTLTDDTVSIVWGFGRRVCPGRHLAEASLWSSMACLLAIFKFSKAKDETGAEIELNPQWPVRLTVRPLPFPCSITPRNAEMDIAALQYLIRASV
ncbi:cytochrome P450 [Suillus paluster]|uniref:cytochrome P450 n=1 Tax=Suillus paluster TaxID=48578 RepID=UPI001B8742CF|nr:cytochrome P450 [Suillus paluster]KAG1744911.1 cytochrome P450 [Suillus paluster]